MDPLDGHPTTGGRDEESAESSDDHANQNHANDDVELNRITSKPDATEKFIAFTNQSSANNNNNINSNDMIDDNKVSRRQTRFLYAYFWVCFQGLLFICMIWGLFGIGYMFIGYPGLGFAYLFGLFIPSIWCFVLLMIDAVIWKENRNTPLSPLKINIVLFCGKYTIRNGNDLLQSLYFITASFAFWGVMIALPAGSTALPIMATLLAVACMVVGYDWDLYYCKKDYNALFGIHENPWPYIMLSSIFQFNACMVIMFGHFVYHWRCIYEPKYYSKEEHANICHDWVPYELCCVVYGLIIFLFFQKRLSGDKLKNNLVPKRVRYYLWFNAFLLFVAFIWMIVEVLDGHVYVYDVTGFLALFYIAPILYVLVRGFKVYEMRGLQL